MDAAFSAKTYEDLRKFEIVEAMEQLLKNKSIDTLSITDICQEAGISRPTFYRYFIDKYDVAQWLWNQVGEKYLAECGRSLGWYESNLGMLESFKDKAAFFSPATQGDEDPNACINHGYRKRTEYLEAVISEYDGVLLTEDLRFQIQFFTDAESRTIAHWLNQGAPASPEKMARRIEACVPRELHAIINKAHQRYLAEHN